MPHAGEGPLVRHYAASSLPDPDHPIPLVTGLCQHPPVTGAARASGITIQGDLPAALANYRRDLTITERLAEAQRDQATATERRRAAFDILSAMDRRGLHLSPDDRQLLDRLRAVFDSL